MIYMKLQLKNLKKNRIVLLCIALSGLIAAACITIGRMAGFFSMNKRLSILNDTVTANSISFFNKYSHSDAEGIESVKARLDGDSYRLTTMDEAISLLKEYPRDYDEAIARRDIFSTGFGFPLFGADVWDRFVAGCRIGQSGNVVMVQFAADMVPVYYFIEFDGNTYHIVEDRSSDSEDGESGYSEWYAKYLKVEEYEAEAGFAEYAFLTDDPDLTYRDIDTYYRQEDSREENAPSAFQFYLGVATEDILQTFMVTPEKVDGDFEEDYIGFTDKHPSFATENPRYDYDNDGILDRVYREKNNAYLMLGNGTTLTLAKDIWGKDMRTESMDISGDGFNDICFVQYTDDDETKEYEPAYFEFKEGEYILSEFPDSRYRYYEAVDEADAGCFFNCKDNDSNSIRLRRSNGEWVIN